MAANRFDKWLKNIFETEEHELSCSECFDSVSRYVDLELTGEDAARQMPEVKQHLGQCPACHAEYEVLHELRQMEDEGAPPSIEDLLP
jgi:predicted anti-sigma-YlaC factor YlaD